MTKPTRRGFLAAATGSAAGLLQARQGQAAEATPPAASEDACILTPQAEEGPYYLDPKMVRAEVTEGKPGVPLALRLRVIEAGSCTPITGARVDIWHCDARGIYSAFPGQGDAHNIDQSGKTFLRGTQMADSAGWIPISQSELGEFLGATRESVNKTLNDWRARSFIAIKRGGLRITDTGALRHIADSQDDD